MPKRKTWRDNLTTNQKWHLKALHIRTKAELESMRQEQVEMRASVPGGKEPCFECRAIARAVGIES